MPGYSGQLGFFRNFSTGTYHIAIAAIYAVNDRQCPPSELLSGPATDFPDCIVAWPGDSVGFMLRFADSQDRSTTVQVPSSPYSVQWMTMRVYSPNTCGSADFDGDGDSGTSEDIEAFFACLAGDCCISCDPRGADFDGDGDAATDGDIEGFFRVLAGGSC